MANPSAIDQNSVSMRAPVSSKLTHKANPWFNVLAVVVVITGIIYAGFQIPRTPSPL